MYLFLPDSHRGDKIGSCGHQGWLHLRFSAQRVAPGEATLCPGDRIRHGARDARPQAGGPPLPLPPRPQGRGGGERGADRVAAEPPLETGRARGVRMQGDEGGARLPVCAPRRQRGRRAPIACPRFDPIRDTSPVSLTTAAPTAGSPRSIPIATPTPTPKGMRARPPTPATGLTLPILQLH